MIKVSGKTKRIVVVGTTLLISCVSGYGLIDWIWLGNGIYDGVTGTQEKLAIILLPFFALILGLDHWFKPKGKGIPKLSILSCLYYFIGIVCLCFFVSLFNETVQNFIVVKLGLPLLGLFLNSLGRTLMVNDWVFTVLPSDRIGTVNVARLSSKVATVTSPPPPGVDVFALI